ncbi:MAG: CPBP family intramembrane metalloprotease [Actinobacteria bacterium]|nr:CPBP family intramembrane metalloprotease [Actinomycetota bacterium]
MCTSERHRRDARTAVPARTLAEEAVVVLSLSLLASAVYAIISLTAAPLKGVRVYVVPQVGFPTQVADFVFGLAPVWLVVYLLRRNGEGLAAIGLAWDRPGRDLGRGAALFVVVGLAGVGIYLGAVALGVNRFVVPVPPLGRWWTVPVLFTSAIQAALLEEVIVAGYLITRLRQLGSGAALAVGASAVLRGAYHLYQGWGGFAGNLALGLFFGLVFLRTRRVWPLAVAHFLLNVGAGVGYLLFREHLPGFS